jgi:membrane protein
MNKQHFDFHAVLVELGKKPLLGRLGVFLRKLILVFKRTLRTFSESRAPEAAASIAYYTFFSLFPLLLVLIALGSFFLDRALVEGQVNQLLGTVIPVSQEIIINNVAEVFESRGTVSLLALLGLIWSSTAVFSYIIKNINHAWKDAPPRSFLNMRLVALAIVGSLTLLLIFSSFTPTLVNMLSKSGLSLDLNTLDGPLAGVRVYISIGLSVFVRMLIFFGLYTWVPRIKVKAISAVTGAMVSAFAWELVTLVFTQYLASGLAQYRLVYGSLGAIAALLIWIYLSSWIILFGAHLTSAIDWVSDGLSTHKD